MSKYLFLLRCHRCSAPSLNKLADNAIADGSVAIVAKEDAWNITVKIAYSSDPTANSDFETTLVSTQTSEEDPGHVCYSVADAPSSVTSGSNATLQLIYVAPEGSSNDTYYVVCSCASGGRWIRR